MSVQPKPIVFLGPSLSHKMAREHLDADYRPPAAAGDVLLAALKKPSAILIIDGYFENVPAVWHKEVLFAIESGVRVFGASSMGALRAAELHAFGMIGIGQIFEQYRSGELEDDDEVTVVHGPDGDDFRPISDAMVNIRHALRLAARESRIDQSEHDALLEIGKNIYYPERVWPRIIANAINAGLDTARMKGLLGWVRETSPNLKRDDAILALKQLCDQGTATPIAPSFELERSIYWQDFVKAVAHQNDAGGAASALLQWAKLRAPFSVMRAALLRYLVRITTESRVPPHRSKYQGTVDAFRLERNLLEPTELVVWLERSGLDIPTFGRLMTEEQLVDELLASHDHDGIERALVDELKLAGLWSEYAAEAEAQKVAANAVGTSRPLPRDAGIEPKELLGWYEGEFGSIAPDVASHAARRGFESTTDFYVAVTRAKLAALKRET